uniref:Exostosin GT47 domain-containing protein n=1 Tax=Populus alba TaxID=43335 RepID=A0A4U5MHQ0_POPAL|nr:hypothetical protein D5086_0000308400 [Populus alba]
MNLRDSPFLTKNPEEAHLFFIPISCQPLSDEEPLPGYREKVIKRYVKSLISTYPYWNRTLGADHFFKPDATCQVNCGVSPSPAVPRDDKPSQVVRYLPNLAVLNDFCASEQKTKLGFWAGSPNSDVRKKLVLFQKDFQEFEFHFVEKLKGATVLYNFEKEIYRSKFCICPRGETQVGGVCLSESMAFGCVPVVMSDYYDLPFNDILDWDKFSVILKEDDVLELEKILKSIPEGKYEKMHQNVLKVRKHFKWHSPPAKYDEFHLVMYELWKRRHIIRY